FDHGWNHHYSPLPCMGERSTGSSCSSSSRSIQGATTLRRVWFIIGRIESSPLRRSTLFTTASLTLYQPHVSVKSVFMIEGGRPGRPCVVLSAAKLLLEFFSNLLDGGNS